MPPYARRRRWLIGWNASGFDAAGAGNQGIAGDMLYNAGIGRRQSLANMPIELERARL